MLLGEQYQRRDKTINSFHKIIHTLFQLQINTVYTTKQTFTNLHFFHFLPK